MKRYRFHLFPLLCMLISNALNAKDFFITQKGDTIPCTFTQFKNGFVLYTSLSNPIKGKEIAIEKLKSFSHPRMKPLLDSIVFKNGESLYCDSLKLSHDTLFYNDFDVQGKLSIQSLPIDQIDYIKFNTPFKSNTVSVFKTYPIDKTSLGIGLGLDYGGIGGNVLYYPHRNIGLFGGLGFAIAGIGINVGTKIRFLSPTKKTNTGMYLLGMYGYNMAVIANGSNYLYYGMSLGVGYDYRRNLAKNSYWSFSMILPFRSSESFLYTDGAEVSPILFSIGYKFILK